MNYDVIIIGAGPGGIFSAYELTQRAPGLKVGVFEAGHALNKRRCPIDGDKVKSCIGCKTCSIMSGFGGAGAFSDGKYNITNDFGGTLYEYIGKKQALDLMHYVDEINVRYGGEGTKLYSTAGTRFKTVCIQNDLHLLDWQLGALASVFMLVYMCYAPLVGYFADRTPRHKWIGASALLWSAATFACSWAKNYFSLLFTRGLIGVGEAGFTTLAQPFLAEHYPPEKRASTLALFGAFGTYASAGPPSHGTKGRKHPPPNRLLVITAK